MHHDRTAQQGETPRDHKLDIERPCFNCGTTPNVRCCEFGRDRVVGYENGSSVSLRM